MIFSSIRWRLWLTYALVIGVVLCILSLAVAVYLVRNPLATRQAYSRLRLIATLIQTAGEGDGVRQTALGRLSQANPASGIQLQQEAERAAAALEVRVAISAGEGEASADPAETNIWAADSGIKSEPPLPNLNVLERGYRPQAPSWFRDSQGRAWLYELVPLSRGRTLLLTVLRPRTPLINILREEFFRPFAWAGLAALGLALLLALWISRWVAAPLQRLAEGTRAVAGGDYQTVPIEGPGEVQELGRMFNEMVDRVRLSRQSQRDFVANVSHELKTPLTSIQGFAQAILDGTADTPESTKQAADVIYTEAARMHRLTRDLLDLASLEAGTAEIKKETVDLANLLREVSETLAPLAERTRVSVELELPARLEITGDCDRLAQVFTNLLENGIKFSPGGSQVRLWAKARTDWAEVGVDDAGPGIPEEDRARVFERFYQVDKSRKGGDRRGTGLGLAIAREIVNAHAGEIRIADTSPHGSLFVVKLPVQ
jgi:signal transduction histidine kinase